MVESICRKRIDADDEMVYQHPILLPEHILKYLLEAGVEIPEDHVSHYWAEHRRRGVPWAVHHESDGTHVPVGLYGDGAKYGEANEKKVWAVWMNLVLFRPASVRLSRYLLFAIDHETSLGNKTLFPLLDAVVTSLNAVYDGSLGRKFAVTEIRGDWEFQYLVFRMRRFWNSGSICWRCNATKGINDPPQTCYLDFSDNPGWKTTEHSTNAGFLNDVIPNAGLRSDVCKSSSSF